MGEGGRELGTLIFFGEFLWIYTKKHLRIFLGALGLSVKGAKNFTISSCPLYVAIKIGVVSNSQGALGLSAKGAKILTTSSLPDAAQ